MPQYAKCLRRNCGTPAVLCYDELNPQARSVIMLVHLLNVNVELRPIDLFRGDHFVEDHEMLNSVQKLPELVHNGMKLTNSHTILMYICENFGGMCGQKLFPSNYYKRLQIIDKLFFDNAILHRRHSEFMAEIIRKTYKNTDVAFHEKKVLSAYAMLESYLRNCGFIAGNILTLADLAIVATVSALNVMFPIENGHDKWPKLCNWFGRMRSLPMYALNSNGILKQRKVIEQFGGFKFHSSIPQSFHPTEFSYCSPACMRQTQWLPQCVPKSECATQPKCLPQTECVLKPECVPQSECTQQLECAPQPQCIPQTVCLLKPECVLQPECTTQLECVPQPDSTADDVEITTKIKRSSRKSFDKKTKETTLAQWTFRPSVADRGNKQKASKVKKKDELPIIWPQLIDRCKCVQNQCWNTCGNDGWNTCGNECWNTCGNECWNTCGNECWNTCGIDGQNKCCNNC